MQRIFGIETEYGCLSLRENPRHSSDAWPRVVRNYLFDDMGVGVMDLHYRDYEEPPGNGGFLKNGGRIYLDLGHLEYATPECRSFFDIAMYDIAGDQTLVAAVHAMGANEDVTFIKNNIDHYTEATFGCHENYLIPRDPTLSSDAVGVLMSFLATRQIYAGTGRVGESLAVISSEEAPRLAEGAPPCNYQISQRADHIVNDIFRWVQFNRAIINARDEPLADNSKYRRLHLLLGDSNMSPYATALKVGTTHCVLTLLEAGVVPEEVILKDAVRATREVSRDLLLTRSRVDEWLEAHGAPDSMEASRVGGDAFPHRRGSRNSVASETVAFCIDESQGWSRALTGRNRLDHEKVAAGSLSECGARRMESPEDEEPRFGISPHRSKRRIVFSSAGQWRNCQLLSEGERSGGECEGTTS